MYHVIAVSTAVRSRVTRNEHGGGMEVGGEGDYIPIAINCHHQNDFCIKVGSDESHFNVS